MFVLEKHHEILVNKIGRAVMNVRACIHRCKIRACSRRVGLYDNDVPFSRHFPNTRRYLNHKYIFLIIQSFFNLLEQRNNAFCHSNTVLVCCSNHPPHTLVLKCKLYILFRLNKTKNKHLNHFIIFKRLCLC